ncbi:hypothetical protein SteCoe_30193 [Stentor coeruleus]|uniref:PX domain-containing protein n=1 Tax=Stentor coeruleus TaxID=5963 RepID=A0A1R2B423_9CILI|nr:hypothetical protein SteCoe_30193 [Stentor coeruleus]
MWKGDKPILRIEIQEAANLKLLDLNIQPFFIITSGDQNIKSKVGISSEDRHTWNEKLSLALDPNSSITFNLFTLQEGQEILIDKSSLPFAEICSLKKSQNTWISFSTAKKQSVGFNISNILTTGIKRETGKSPQLNVTLIFIPNNFLRVVGANIQGYRIVLKGKDAYTVYNVHVTRNDGKTWVKQIRYSQVYAIKNELESVEHGLASIDFPGKTYFEFLSCVWPTLGRFHPENIEKRRKGIEEVLKYIVSRYKNFGADSLNNLLENA